MKARLLLLVAALLAVGVVIWRAETWPRPDGRTIPTAAEAVSDSAEEAATPSAPAEAASPPAQASLGQTPDAAAGIEVEMEPVKFVIRDFRAALGENPVGNNTEITKALMGANRKKTRFLDTGAFRLNDRGELVDRWGTPYFFHQISGKEMEIRSAGPDKRMWTGDDIVMR